MTTATAKRPARPKRAKFDPDAYAAKWTALSERLDTFRKQAGGEVAQAAQLDAALTAFGEHYSDRNCLLILMQDEAATEVRTARQWQDSGRQVLPYPLGEEGITLVRFRGEAKPADDGQAAPAFGAKPEQHDVTADEGTAAKPSKHFGLFVVHDVRRTIAITCADCGEPIHRTGLETAEQMQARGGRRQAATWAHSKARPADGHDARRLYVETPQAAAAS